MPDRSLLSIVRGLRDREEREEIASALGREEWTAELHALMRLLRTWLRAAESEGLVRVEAMDLPESDGPEAPHAPGLRVALPGGRTLWVKSGGMLAVGAKGWVDITCGANRAMIVLNRKGVWKARGCDPLERGAKLEELDEARFATIVEELAE